MRIIKNKKNKVSKKKKKMYPPMKGGFQFKKNAKQWIRAQDVDQAVYYPNRTKV